MRKINILLKVSLCLLVFILVSLVFVKKDAKALSQSLLEKRYINSYDAGWCYSSQRYHMDKVETNYYIYSEKNRAKYKSYFEKGVEHWKGNVVVKYTEKGVGYINGEYNDEEYVAYAKVSGNSAGITTQWFIMVNDKYFETLDSFCKSETMVHELGHVYGLGDLYRDADWQNVMYYRSNPVKGVTSADIIGMKVMTGQHRHSANCSRRYEMINTDIHKAICMECKSYILEEHTHYSYCEKCSY